MFVLLCIQEKNRQVMKHWAVDLPVCSESEGRRMYKAKPTSYLLSVVWVPTSSVAAGDAVGGRALFKLLLTIWSRCDPVETMTQKSSFPDAEIPQK